MKRVLVGQTGNRGLRLLYHLRASEQVDVAEIVEKRPPSLFGLATLDFTCDYGRFSMASPDMHLTRRRLSVTLYRYSGVPVVQ